MSRGEQQSITEVIGEVTRALVPALTKDEMRQRVCERFAASELYSFAWIGRYIPEREEVLPTASAGITESTLDGVSITEESSQAELTNEAVRTREVTVERDLLDDPPCEGWHDHALEHDYRTFAVIPLVYEGTRYGILHLATNRPHGFGTLERESLAELGGTIAYAVENAESPANTDSAEYGEAEAELTRVAAESDRKRRLYETIISSTPDLVYAFDLDYRFIFANDALLDMWGMTLEESMGKTLREIGYEPWHAEMHEREIDQVVETKEPIRGEVGFEHAELGHRIYDYIFAPVLDDEGEVEAIAGTTRDITERKEAEEALQKSEERFRSLVTASSDVVYRMSPDWSEMQHLEGKEFIADTHEPTSDWVGKYIPPDEQEHVREAIDEAIRTKSTFELEHRVEQADGTVGWTFSRAVPILDEDGDIVEWVGMASDITERKEMEQELRESEAKFRMLAENLEETVWMATPDVEEFIYINPAFEDVWGLDRDELYDEPLAFLEAVHADDRERVRKGFAALPDEEFDEEFRIVHADGEIRWVHGRGARVHGKDGEMARIVGIGEDITERKERQRQLEQSEQRYRALAEHFPNGVVGIYDHDLRYTLAAGERLGDPAPSKEEVEGTRMPDLYPDDAVGDLEPLFRAAIEDGESGTIETEVVGRHWQVWAAPLRDADGEIFAGLSFAQDITEQIERERRLEELVDRLEESNERLEQFAYAASHDLQEPLRMVSSYLQLLERRYEDALDAEGEEYLEFAVDGADRMREMIEGLLEYSRIETRGKPLEPIDLEAVMEDVLADLTFQIESSNARITADSLPRVEGDASQLRQVFQNLLENAIEYSGDEPPRVHVGAERDGSEWVVSVRDEGVGIDPADQERIFEVFQRLHTYDEHDGTGIGLALCERIVERHGGDIWATSEPGDGTTFSFTLPAVDE